MPNLTTRLMTMLTGSLVGRDAQGNKYYRGRGRPGMHRERRWVMYAGGDEASKVPPAWHAWLHHMNDEPPADDGRRYAWQKEHQPNLTGTPDAYRPKGSVLNTGQHAPTTSDYEPWRPA